MFDWDDENKKQLAAHKVTPADFEQVLNNDPIDLAYDLVNEEERYRSVGLTNGGRLLSVAWTIRNGKVRAITAFRSWLLACEAATHGIGHGDSRQGRTCLKTVTQPIFYSLILRENLSTNRGNLVF